MINVGAHVVIGQSLRKKRTRFINRKKPKKCCANCSHVGQETTDDVACCNCCDDGEFYDEVEEEEEDPFHENDPYVVTNPMAFY